MIGYQPAYFRKLNATEWLYVRSLWKQGSDTLDISRKLGVHESVIANRMCQVRDSQKGVSA